MNYQNILKVAKSKLPLEFNNVIEDIKSVISAGSTGGEISSSVGKYLKELKFSNPIAYSLLEPEILLYLVECKKSGLEII